MYEFLDYCVEDVMSAPALSVAPHTTLGEIEQLFARHDYNGLPVLDAKGDLIGFVTKLDLLSAFRFDDEHLFPPYDQIMSLPASSVMSSHVQSVCPRTPLTRVLEKLVASHRRSFPVVDGEDLVGMIARADVLTALCRASAGTPAAPRSHLLPEHV